MAKFYAHTLEGEPPTNWQALEEHLHGVAKLAARFAGTFDSEPWGYLAGLWHDLGKYQIEFQQRLLGSQVSVEHSGAGAALAFKKSKELGMPWLLPSRDTTRDLPTLLRVLLAYRRPFGSA